MNYDPNWSRFLWPKFSVWISATLSFSHKPWRRRIQIERLWTWPAKEDQAGIAVLGRPVLERTWPAKEDHIGPVEFGCWWRRTKASRKMVHHGPSSSSPSLVSCLNGMFVEWEWYYNRSDVKWGEQGWGDIMVWCKGSGSSPNNITARQRIAQMYNNNTIHQIRVWSK